MEYLPHKGCGGDARALSRQPLQQVGIHLVGRVAELEIKPERAFQHRLVVAECVEAALAVVTAHSAGSDAAEGQLGNAGLHHYIVEADPT